MRVCDNLDEGEFTENSKAVLDCVPALGEVLSQSCLRPGIFRLVSEVSRGPGRQEQS